jgi:hypothetical protein
MKLTSIVLALALTFAAGCSKKDKGDGSSAASGKVASCLMEAVQSCREYRGGNLALGTESLEKLCTVVISSAKFAETACPTAKVIATCAKPEGKEFYYEGYAEPAQQLEESCKQTGGTFATK